MNKVYDGYGELIGYEKCGFYLMKHPTFGNHFGWIINKTGQSFYHNCEFSEALDNGEVIIVSSFKEGKAKIDELLTT